MAFARVNCRAKIRRSTILPTARVHRNRHGAISRALDTLPNSISLTPVPAHRRRTFYLDGWITTWKCIFGPFCARLVPSFESWNLRRCKACRSQRASSFQPLRKHKAPAAPSDSCCTIERLDGSAAKRLSRRSRCMCRCCVVEASPSCLVSPGRQLAKWRNDMATRNWGDDSAVDRTLGSSASQAIWCRVVVGLMPQTIVLGQPLRSHAR